MATSKVRYIVWDGNDWSIFDTQEEIIECLEYAISQNVADDEDRSQWADHNGVEVFELGPKVRVKIKNPRPMEITLG